MARMTKMLRMVTAERCVGFKDAVLDLGTHEWCGHEVNYSLMQVRNILTGKAMSAKLLRVIAERRPDMFDIAWVAPQVREAGRKLVAEMEVAA